MCYNTHNKRRRFRQKKEENDENKKDTYRSVDFIHSIVFARIDDDVLVREKDSISKIVGTYINLNGACSIGIVNKKTEGKAEAKKRNYLVTFDEENRIEEVVFFKDKTNDSGEITQESIKGEIDKCYVTREFTFLRFAAGGAEYNAYRDEEYYTWDYRCDDSYQSFVVDNATGKVYSLESVGSNCTLMQGGILADGVAYTLSIDGEDCRVKRIVDNPNIHVYSVCKDIYVICLSHPIFSTKWTARSIILKAHGEQAFPLH